MSSNEIKGSNEDASFNCRRKNKKALQQFHAAKSAANVVCHEVGCHAVECVQTRTKIFHHKKVLAHCLGDLELVTKNRATQPNHNHRKTEVFTGQQTGKGGQERPVQKGQRSKLFGSKSLGGKD